jgi:ABC-type phosphate transport system permease subunit
MTAAMTAIATGSDQVTAGNPAFYSLFFVGLLLFAITMALNLIADAYVRRVRRQI